MKYEHYNIEDFLMDEFFIRWVKHPDDDTNHFWHKWINEFPEKRETLDAAAGLIRSISYKQHFEIQDKKYIETFENILKNTSQPSTKTKKWFGFFTLRNVAAFLLIPLISWLGYGMFAKNTENFSPLLENQQIVKETTAGKKSIITLSDSTKVYLNSNSKLTYSKDFSDSIREVFISGEAFFEVHKETRPFIVRTNDVSIQVLGTSFNVKLDNKKLAIALVSGKVRIDDVEGNQVHLQPNEMLVMEERVPSIISDFDFREILGWKDKYLVFKKSNLHEVKTKLENWYGVEIEIKGHFGPNWTYSGIYQDEMLVNVLKGIQHTSGIRYEIKNKKVTILNPLPM